LSFWDLLKEDFVEMANYCFSVELMPESMRQALIQVLRVPGGKEVKISQYADDKTCIVTNSYGLVKVIDVFNEYGRASGARLNTTKSKGSPAR
jgi:hypothetical protein